MRSRAIVLAAALVMAPLSARAADLVAWWEKGFYAQEDDALREIIAAFEQKTAQQTTLVFYPQTELPAKITAALEVNRPPDIAFGLAMNTYIPKWAFEDRLVDLSDEIGQFSKLFDPYQLDRAMLFNVRTEEKALYGLPIGQVTNNLHVWKSLLELAGFTGADIPRQWDAFWSFWCEQVQPALRQATGGNGIWGIGLPMSAEADDTVDQFFQFVAA